MELIIYLLLTTVIVYTCTYSYEFYTILLYTNNQIFCLVGTEPNLVTCLKITVSLSKKKKRKKKNSIYFNSIFYYKSGCMISTQWVYDFNSIFYYKSGCMNPPTLLEFILDLKIENLQGRDKGAKVENDITKYTSKKLWSPNESKV